VLAPALAALDTNLPADLSKRSPLATTWRAFEQQLNRFITNGLAAA
jgi:hypothetical protein